jgi:hypothetical protein
MSRKPSQVTLFRRKDFRVFILVKRNFVVLIGLCLLAVGPDVGQAQQAPRPPLGVKQLHDAVNAVVARGGGNIRMSLDRCKEDSLEATCYYSMSNTIAVKAGSGLGEEKRLALIDIEAPVDKEGTDRLYRMSTLFALTLSPGISDAEITAIRADLNKARDNIFGDAASERGGLSFILQLGVDKPRAWWERWFLSAPKSTLRIVIDSAYK